MKMPALSLQIAKFGTTLRALAAVVALGIGFAAAPAIANPPHLRIAQNEIGRTQYVEVGVNKSVIIDLPVEAGEVIVSQPNVANAIMRTRSRAVIQGMAAGDTNIFFLDPAGAGIAVIEISVVQDATGLAATINRLVPGARVEVESFADAVVLSGNVNSGADLEKAVEIAAQYAGGDGNVTSVINVAGGQQVALKVVVAEIKRDVARELGINLSGSLSVGSLNLGLNNVPDPEITSNGASANFAQGGFQIDAALRALQSNNAVRLLAEPVLTAMSGEEADFHVGGELPIRVIKDGEETFDYKEYGIKLNFTPTVHSNGMIGVVIDTEVSEPQLDNTLNTRRASTTVQLNPHQTLAIAGLFEERSRRRISEMPGISSIPILGALFRSYEYVNEQTELVILVTPTIAQSAPMQAHQPLPTDKYRQSSDAEAMFLGRMESLYGVSDGGTGGGQFRGSVGFVLD